MTTKDIYMKWYEQLGNSEVEKHYRRFDNPDADIIEALSEAYAWVDLYDLLTDYMKLGWYDEMICEFTDIGVLDTDRWRITADAIEETGCPFGSIILALDMYLDGMFDDDEEDSIGRMEDYEVETC